MTHQHPTTSRHRLGKILWISTFAFDLPLVILIATFFYISSPRWDEADYDNTITYNHPPGPDNPDILRVATYNLGYLSGMTNQQAVVRDRGRLETNQGKAIAALQPQNLDVLALQEVDFDAYRSFHLNQQYALSSALALPFAALAVNWDKRYVPFPYWPPQAHYRAVTSGQAVLSRYPIRRNHRLVLERVPTNPFYYNALYLDRVAQMMELDLSGQPLMVMNVHLEAFDAPTRLRQTAVVRQLAEQYAETMPVVLLGDFNSDLDRAEERATGEMPSIQTLLDSPVLASASPVEAQSATFPSDQPQYSLDYIFYTPATLAVRDWQIITTAAQASDHLPMMATLERLPDGAHSESQPTQVKTSPNPPLPTQDNHRP
ncbi:metal-dependent hydrolase [Leptolyngbya sp. BL0902]|uniref:endonuclease/exonuclease/phosphatase family protein n=1 Tax=Leptolyngbya sp. BL0902 TaxID=1115757 RepID=UPI0018E6E6DF|nr:endonuclease/exonuclease/phosphatase family protein [Leptolyngbya sp. BL0902]QQE67121.1 metal-dependent hydrolase [Leptolyngbya sp. BL0902]